MSAASARRALAAIGLRLLETRGGPSKRRAEALADGGALEEAATLKDLAAAPSWLSGCVDDRALLARRAALLSIAPTLASSIDGAWLGRVAEVCGEAELDLAIASTSRDDRDDAPVCPPEGLEARGIAMMRRALPPRLRRFLPAEDGTTTPSDERSAALVNRALGLGR